MRKHLPLLLALLTLLPAAAHAALPSYFPLPPGLHADEDAVEEDWGEAPMALGPDGEPPMKRGRHWYVSMQLTGLPEGAEGHDAWARIKPALLKAGWTVVWDADLNPTMATFHYQRGGKEAWGHMKLPDPSDIRMDLVEVGPQPLKFSVPAPAPQPEKVSAETGDFPYLPPLPGSERTTSSLWDGDFFVPIPGQEEQERVAEGAIDKTYRKQGLSNVQFVTVYADALKAAGWTVLDRNDTGSDGYLFAHYAKAPRDLWAYLHTAAGEYVLRVADVGKDDLAAKLAKDCRVELRGVLFDFDKATLKPDSASVLTRARDALKAQAQLAVEVQGHTDNVGDAAYNKKLSQARAQAVVDWLVKNGIPATRLTAQGYGRDKPVAGNDSAEGRAKNRRVELACRKAR